MTKAERAQRIDELLEHARGDQARIDYWKGVHERAEAAKRAIKAQSTLYGRQPDFAPLPNGFVRTEDLKAAALALPKEQRAELVNALLDSLETEVQGERASVAEIRRRYEEIEQDEAELIDGEEVFAELRARHGSPLA